MSDDIGTDQQSSAPGVFGMLAEPLTEDLVHSLLYNVIDPELGVNIVDLGLIYEVKVDDPTGVVEVNMTLTTPGCPLSGYMDDEIRRQLAPLPQVRDIRIEIVWEPEWTPEMMSDAGREMLGWG